MTLELARPGKHGIPRNNTEALWENINDDASFRQELQRWRTEDIEQRVLNNAVVLWDRYAEANRRFSEERSEQLKSFANLSALITGFAIVSYLQFDFDVADTNQGLVFAFGFTMAVVVGLSINAMSLCGLVHAALLKTAKLYVDESEEAEYMRRSRDFALQYRAGDRPPQPRRDIQSFWLNHCEDEWQKAFFLFSSRDGHANGPALRLAPAAEALWVFYYAGIYGQEPQGQLTNLYVY